MLGIGGAPDGQAELAIAIKQLNGLNEKAGCLCGKRGIEERGDHGRNLHQEDRYPYQAENHSNISIQKCILLYSFVYPPLKNGDFTLIMRGQIGQLCAPNRKGVH